MKPGRSLFKKRRGFFFFEGVFFMGALRGQKNTERVRSGRTDMCEKVYTRIELDYYFGTKSISKNNCGM